MSRVFYSPKEILEQKIESLFSSKDDNEIDVIFRILSIFLFQNENNEDILNLYNVLDLESFVKVVSLYEGRSVKFPEKRELRSMLLFSFCYYYKEIKGMSWEEIKDKIPFEISSISYGIKIKNFNKYLLDRINELFAEE